MLIQQFKKNYVCIEFALWLLDRWLRSAGAGRGSRSLGSQPKKLLQRQNTDY
jgi:hypothetical protein